MKHSAHPLPMVLALATAAVALPRTVPALEYEKDILPIFEEKCADCHSAKAEKIKGGLHLDDPERFARRFAKNDVVIPGNWDASYLFVTVSRPHEDKDAMPPTDKGTPLTHEELLLVANWIYQGAEINGERGEKGAADDLPETYIQPGKDIQEQMPSAEPEAREVRAWTNLEGKTISARLLRVDGDDAILQLEDGTVYRYPIAKLSGESRSALEAGRPGSD